MHIKLIILLICACTTSISTTPCDPGTFRPSDASPCQPCTQCEVGEQFSTRQCNATHDAICANCTVCTETQFEYSACEGDRDTACRPCSACVPGVSYATSDCGPEISSDRVCSRCSSCAFELSPCDATHDSVCGTLVTLTLASELPASAFTRAMLSVLGAAVASGLGLPSTAVEVLGAHRRRTSFTITVDLRIRGVISPQQIDAMDRDAVARASGLPITLLSASIHGVAPQKATEAAPANSLYTGLTVGIVLGTVIAFVCAAGSVHRKRRRRRKVADNDGFTDLSAVVLMQTEEPRSVHRTQ